MPLSASVPGPAVVAMEMIHLHILGPMQKTARGTMVVRKAGYWPEQGDVLIVVGPVVLYPQPAQLPLGLHYDRD